MWITPHNADSSRSREGMPFPSPNSTRARRRTRGRLRTFLWIQEISQTWCVAKFQFECDYRVPSGPFYQPVNSRTESHQNKPNKGEKSHFCLWLSEKDSKRRHPKGQVLLPSHDLAGLKRNVFSTGFIAVFPSTKTLYWEFPQANSHWTLFNRKGSGIFFLRATVNHEMDLMKYIS